MTFDVFSRARERRPRRPGRPGPWIVLAAWGPCGFVPVAPGTFGTLGAIPLYLALSRVGTDGYVAALAAFCLLAAFAAERAGRWWGVADASQIVIDEVAGYLVTMALVPFSWRAVLAGFLLFRVFDVIKPWPASALDRVKNGLGVVLDDLAAGVWAWAALRAVRALGIVP